MKALLPLSSNTLSIIKKVIIITLLLIWLSMPELFWQKLSFIAYKISLILHLIYEGCAFLLEEALIHGFDFPKHHAQMTVFYSFLIIGLGFLYWFWRRLPDLLNRLKTQLQEYLTDLKFQLLKTWLLLSIWQKFKYLLFHLTAVAGVFVMMLS
jgi:hypothetical protein